MNKSWRIFFYFTCDLHQIWWNTFFYWAHFESGKYLSYCWLLNTDVNWGKWGHSGFFYNFFGQPFLLLFLSICTWRLPLVVRWLRGEQETLENSLTRSSMIVVSDFSSLDRDMFAFSDLLILQISWSSGPGVALEIEPKMSFIRRNNYFLILQARLVWIFLIWLEFIN